MTARNSLLAAIANGRRIEYLSSLALLADAPTAALMDISERVTLAGHGRTVTYSRKVFIPLTKLCRDVCHYCTFAKAPRALGSPYLELEQVLDIAHAGKSAGCKEALFTLGDQPERRYPTARRWLDAHGYETTLDYLETAAHAVHAETGLLPHLNPGVMSLEDIAKLRRVSVSMGLMLESSSERLTKPGGPHWGSPDKHPAMRLATIEAAGIHAVPFTTGLLIGIGETRLERLQSLLALRDLHDRHGHIQEIIIQNFRAKPGTRMASAPEPDIDEQLWTIAVARLLFGPAMTIQAPPNLQPDGLAALLRAGVNDWGGVSPVTPDHVNPEAPWPHLAFLAKQTEAAGRHLTERLAIGPAYVRDIERWVDKSMQGAARRAVDAQGRAYDGDWHAGCGQPLPPEAIKSVAARPALASPEMQRLLDRAQLAPQSLTEDDIVALFDARGDDLAALIHAADALRAECIGDDVTYVINRNINYTNICLHKCGFCAFSKGSTHAARGAAYVLDLDEVAKRSVEAWDAGATEVCLQGGIHPNFTGETYLAIVHAVKKAVPKMHIHAFSPLEIAHGARTLGLTLDTYLQRLKQAGLATLPGTAAEILDDEVRRVLCPDKLKTTEWLEVMRAAHSVGLRSTATIMFGHVETPRHWARHLLHIRHLQQETGGFTEFVPLPFVHMESPMWLKGQARSGPTWREALLMHAVARLALHPLIANIQTSWVKMGPEGAAQALQCGANDLGGVLMEESITRAAGGVNGQRCDATQMRQLAAGIGRPARQRTTLYERTTERPRNAIPERFGETLCVK